MKFLEETWAGGDVETMILQIFNELSSMHTIFQNGPCPSIFLIRVCTGIYEIYYLKNILMPLTYDPQDWES